MEEIHQKIEFDRTHFLLSYNPFISHKKKGNVLHHIVMTC